MARTGRPKFHPTKNQRDRVMRLRADGWSQERIARRIGIDVGTLTLHFADELEHGADVKREELLEHADKAARKGNATLIKWLHERQTAAAAAEQLRHRESAPAPAEPKASKLGKKDERQQAAEKVGGKYAPPPPPKLH